MEKTLDIGPLRLTRNDDGWAKIEIEPWGDDWEATWPTHTAPEHWHSLGEEIAKALALIDGRFEVRRYA